MISLKTVNMFKCVCLLAILATFADSRFANREHDNGYRSFDPEEYLKDREENENGMFDLDGSYERTYDGDFDSPFEENDDREMREFFEELAKEELQRHVTDTLKQLPSNGKRRKDDDHDSHARDHDDRKHHHDHKHSDQYDQPFSFQDFLERNHCFDFAYVFRRHLLKFPDTSNFVRNTAVFDLGFSDIAEQAITSLRLIAQPRLIAKEMVHRLVVRILNDLDGCPATKVHQGIVYGLSKAMEQFTTKHRDHICQFSDDLDKVSPYIGPKRVFDEFKQNVFYQLMDMISDAGYEDMFEDLSEMEDALEKKLSDSLKESKQLDIGDLEPLMTFHLKSTIGCQDESSVQELIKDIHTKLQHLDNGIPLEEILSELREPMEPYFENSTIYHVAGLIQKVGTRLIREVNNVYDAFVNSDIDYLINNQIIEPGMQEDLERLIEFIGDVNFSASVTVDANSRYVMKRSVNSNLLNRLIRLLKENELSSQIKRNISSESPGVSISTESPNTSNKATDAAYSGYTNEPSTPEIPIFPHCRALIGENNVFPSPSPCFNFGRAVSDILGGFPRMDGEQPATDISLNLEDLQGAIEKSLTAYRIFNDADASANELIFSVSEMILEKQKRCPATMLKRVIFYILAKSLFSYESEKLESIQNLAEEVGNSELEPVVEESNRFAIGFLLSNIREHAFVNISHHMRDLYINVSKVLSEPNVSTKKLERVLEMDQPERWTFQCNDHVHVRNLLEMIKGSIEYLIHDHLKTPRLINGTILPKHTRYQIQKIVMSSLTGFVERVDSIFMAVLKEDRKFLVDQNLLTDDQVDYLNEIIFEIGGDFLPDFVSPVTENELSALKEFQDVLINNISAQEIKERIKVLVLQRCAELQNVHINLSDEEVREFFENCKTLHARVSVGANVNV